jgi:capsular polysaccharide export protein
MKGYQSYAGFDIARSAPPPPRSFLFLQGPISSFFDRLGRALLARGHRVHRINLHLGDQLFWRLPATNFRGRFEDWREFIAAQLDRHQITDLVLHGDRRPYHLVAAEEARARGIAVYTTDLGYVRPDWITLEYDGMTTYSRFPRDPDTIRALAAELDPPDLEPRFQSPFWLIATLDVAYNLGLVFGRPLFPRYRYHSIVHPFAEYAGWLWSRGWQRFTKRAADAEKERLQQAPGTYFLVPLQLATDYQIRAHSPFRDGCEAAREIIASFARSGSSCELVFIAHPLDNGLTAWDRVIARLGREFGVADRVLSLPGATPYGLLHNAAGIVTINSTIGVTALRAGVPVKTLGNAVFDIPGLTCQSPLDRFWESPPHPDPELMAAFLRALVGTTQVKGGYYERASQECAIAGFIARLENGPYPLPRPTPADFAARPPRLAARTVVVAGLSNGVGLALARAHAGPGIRLVLIGIDASVLQRAAGDCRYRGALVETFRAPGGNAEPVRAFLEAVDRRAPIDDLLVPVDAAAIGRSGIADGELRAAMDGVAALAAPMRRRGRGSVVLLGGLAGRGATSDRRFALPARSALVEHGAALRRRLAADGVEVTIVVPGIVALRSAARLDAPDIAELGAERVGAAIGSGRRRNREVISVPGSAVAVDRAVRAFFRRLRHTVRDSVPPVIVPEPDSPSMPLVSADALGRRVAQPSPD